ncbi:MAG: glutamyl-tRNA reductase [Methylophilaceae bacterium]|jgi:glutamyl-tRNA reductase
MKVTVLGINHKSAPISLREKLVFNQDAITQSLNEFKKKFNSGVVILSTCNRTEIYSSILNRKEIEIWLSKHHGVKISELSKHSYFFSKIEALKHAAAVGAGLDSMIIGEPQVLGQIKQAFKVSQNGGLVDQGLILFFNKVFELSKIIRTKTQIGTNSTTIASTALKLILKIFGELKQLSVLFIGAGEMNELCAKYFAKHHPKKIMIANRTLQRAEQLGKKINAQSCLIGDVNKIIHQYDVVVSCTGSQLPIIGLGMIEEAIEKRKHQPMFFVDLAIPADIEKEIENLDDTFLYNLDDLANIAQEGMTMREQELVNAFNLLEDLIENFVQNKKNKNISLTIALKTYFEHVQENELKKALKDIKNGSQADEVCKKLARNLTKKLLHHPTKSLNENKKNAQIIKEIFNLKD